MLLVTSSGCGHGQRIPDVAVYRELPFADAPEALEVWTVSDKERIVGPEEWEKMRPFMLMIPPETWSEIKKGWLTACRLAGPDCANEVESVDKFVKQLDGIVKGFLGGR
jgi:hypothetical protein